MIYEAGEQINVTATEVWFNIPETMSFFLSISDPISAGFDAEWTEQPSLDNDTKH